MTTDIVHDFIPPNTQYTNKVCIITETEFTKNKLEQLGTTFHPSQLEPCIYHGHPAHAFLNPTETQMGMLKLFAIEKTLVPVKQFAKQYAC